MLKSLMLASANNKNTFSIETGINDDSFNLFIPPRCSKNLLV